MARISVYRKAFAEAFASETHVVCSHCGAATPVHRAGRGSAFCQNCENVVESTRDEPADNPELAGVLDAYITKLSRQDFDGAVKEYEKALTTNGSPANLYVNGLNYIMYSNYELSLVRYDLAGFMEENARHRLRSIELYTQARLFFNKAIFMAKNRPGELPAAEDYYVSLLCNVKLGKLRQAYSDFNSVNRSGAPALATYAGMVLDTALGRYDYAMRVAGQIALQRTPSVNAMYYISFSLFKLGRLSEAEKVAAIFGKYSNSVRLTALLKDIHAAKEI